MNHQDISANQVATEVVEDLELTDQEAGETKAGADKDKFESYLEIKLQNAFVSGHSM